MTSDEKNKELLTMVYNRAIELIGERDLSGAVEMLNQAWELGGDNPQYLEVLGLCFYARGSFEQAGACWRRSVELDHTLSNSERYLKYMDSAEFAKYIKLFNSCIEAVEKGKHAKALWQLMPALELMPNVEGFNLAGLLFYQLRMKNSALKLWKKALNIDLADKTAVYYIAHSGEGLIPLAFEKILWGVLALAGKLKLL